MSGPDRRLAAVMFLDMVGYSALMSSDEGRALACVRELEALLREEVGAAGGRVVKFLGDGSMCEFGSAAAAVACARRVQERLAGRNAGRAEADRLRARIGLHLGDRVEEGADIFGDAVNIAARVEPLADPGGIAMTEAVYAQVKSQPGLEAVALPPQKLKNIPQRMAVYVVPPADGAGALWALRRRAAFKPWAAAAAALLLAGAGALAYRRLNPGPVKVALLYIVSGEEAGAREMARSLEEALSVKVAASPGFLWVDPNGIRDLFAAEGLSDFAQVERLEWKACSVARKGGLQYSLVGRLGRAGAAWRVEAKVICTKTRSVVGVLAADGAQAGELADGLLRGLKGWAVANGLARA